MKKGKSHCRTRVRILNSIRRGQARKVKAIVARQQAYDQHAYDGSDPDVCVEPVRR
jgi:hypothetical protein